MKCKNCNSEMEFVDQFSVWCPECGTITNGESASSEWWKYPRNLNELCKNESGSVLLHDVLSFLKIQEDYINFLSEYANKHSGYLRIHGIVPTKEEIDKGQDLRDNIEIYAKKVFENGKLLEKIKNKGKR